MPLVRGNYQAWEVVDAGARMIQQIVNIPLSAPSRPLRAQISDLVELSDQWAKEIAANQADDRKAA